MSSNSGQPIPLSAAELLTLILQEWLKHPTGNHKKVATALNERHKAHDLQLTGNTVKRKIKEARDGGLLAYKPRRLDTLADRVRVEGGVSGTYPQVQVVETADAAHVAEAVADHVVHAIRNHRGRDDFHIGFFAGRTNSLVAKALALRFARAKEELDWKRRKEDGPTHIHFHSLVGTLDAHDPEMNPNSFPLYFVQLRDAITASCGPDRFRYHSFPVAGAVAPPDFDRLCETDVVAHRVRTVPRFDIIICSCGHLGCKYTLTKYLKEGCETVPVLSGLCDELESRLKEADCIGDVAWHPVCANGPLDLSVLPLRMATLLDLREVQQRAKGPVANGQVVVAVSPCSDPRCERSKSELLRWVMQHGVAHHVFVDSRSAREYVGEGTVPVTIADERED